MFSVCLPQNLGSIKSYQRFILWLSSKLETIELPTDSDLYIHHDRNVDLYFIAQGSLGFVFDLFGEPYYQLEKGQVVGFEDIIFRLPIDERNLLCDKEKMFANIEINVEHVRRFSVRVTASAKLFKLCLSEELTTLQSEFPLFINHLFVYSLKQLKEVLYKRL